MKLPEYVKDQAWMKGATLDVSVPPAEVTPRLIAVLRALGDLGLTQDSAIMALLAQAPVDPLRLLVPLGKRLGGWTLNPNDATLLSVLAKVGSQPVALCVADLLSSRVVFVALRGGTLAELSAHEPEVLVEKLRTTGSVQGVIDWLEQYLEAAVVAGTGRSISRDGGS